MREIRYALRLLRRSPGFTLVTVLTLALGIGVNAGLFSIVNAVMLRPLPYPHPEQLVAFLERIAGEAPGAGGSVAPANLADYGRNRSLAGIVHIGVVGANLTGGGGPPERLAGVRATANFFSVIGVQPLLGRAYGAEEDRYGARHVVVLAYELWQDRFAGDRRLLGGAVQLDGVPYEVIGVMPPGFQAPLQALSRVPLQFYVPAAFDPDLLRSRGDHEDSCFARLREGVSLEAAQAEMSGIAAQLARAYPRTNGNVSVELQPLVDRIAGAVRTPLLVLLGAVGLVLLIACANVANLLLARGIGHRREIAVRTALGASRGRIVRQLLAQSALLAAAGGASGVLAAALVTRLLVALGPADIPRLASAGLDGRVLAYAALLAAATVVLFGLVPALVTSAVAPRAVLAAAPHASGEDRAPLRWRGAPMAAEVALALTLLIGSGLLLKSLVRLGQVDLGFAPDNVLAFDLDLPEAKYPSARARLAFFASLEQRLAGLPGVTAAAFGRLPLRGHWSSTFETAEHPAVDAAASRQSADFQMVSAGYFKTLGIPLAAGRAFDGGDRDGAAPVVIVNAAMARRWFPHGDALGHRLRRSGAPAWRTIVGVVGAVHLYGQAQEVAPQVYLPAAQTDSYPMAIAGCAVRAARGPEALLKAVQREVWSLDRDQPLTRVEVLRDTVTHNLAQRRFQAILLFAFAALALVLALLGIYGVVAYAVAQRTAEIGLRIALGARRADIFSLVLRQGMLLVGLGVAGGLAGALAASRALASLLFHVAPFDPATFLTLAALAAATALAACCLPARRAAAADPMTALRHT